MGNTGPDNTSTCPFGYIDQKMIQVNSRLLHILTRLSEFEERFERVEKWLENIEEAISKEN